MDDTSILGRINDLVNEEHQLRTAVQSGSLGSDEERSRLRAVEEALDQCWDLLRRRRAAHDNHQDAEHMDARSVAEVEGYLQ